MRRSALETIKEYDMLPQGSRVIVGFSGGADSVALLSFLYELQQELDLKLLACHINHQLRGDEAQRDEEFCRKFCAERGIELHVFREDIASAAKQAGKSIEEYAREVRYERFQQLCSSEKDRIATAHNANDLAETILFHVARGTGIKGLIGIPAVRGNIIRPLLFCSREQIEAYCKEKALPFVTDSSNLSDEFSRNRLRHHVVPQLELVNPSFVKSAARLSKQAALEEDYLQKRLEQELAQMQLSENTWKRSAFQALHPAMQQRAAAYWLERSFAEISAKKISDVRKLIDIGGTLELSKGHYLEAMGETITLKSAPKLQSFFSVPLKKGENRIFDGKILRFSSINRRKYKFFANNEKDGLKNAFDYDKIIGVPMIRQRLPGDSIQLHGWSSPRSFKKLLNQKKISLEERSRLAVISDEKGPLWLEGFGVRQDVMPDEHSEHIVTICVLEE